MGTAVAATLTKSIFDLAKEVYQVYGESTQAAGELLARIACEGVEHDFGKWGALELLKRERLRENQPVYAKAHGLRERLSVEAPPLNWRRPDGQPSPVRVTGARQDRIVLMPIAALRAALDIKIPLNRKVASVRTMTREEVIIAARRLREQGNGCLHNAALLDDFAAQMLPGEKGIDTVRRLEKGEAV